MSIVLISFAVSLSYMNHDHKTSFVFLFISLLFLTDNTHHNSAQAYLKPTCSIPLINKTCLYESIKSSSFQRKTVQKDLEFIKQVLWYPCGKVHGLGYIKKATDRCWTHVRYLWSKKKGEYMIYNTFRLLDFKYNQNFKQKRSFLRVSIDRTNIRKACDWLK